MDAEQLEQINLLVTSLVGEHKLRTPFLFIDQDRVASALRLLRDGLPNVRLCYAVKANSTPSLIHFFVEQGLTLDVASAGEIISATSIGVPGDRLFLSAPIKTPETLNKMFTHSVACCTVDTLDEVERIYAFRQEKQYTHSPKLFVRLRIKTSGVEVDLNTKFGCTPTEAIDIIERASRLGMELGGVSFHVGTQCINAGNYLLGIRTALSVAEEARHRFHVRLPGINIGGGFCDMATAARAGISLPAFYAAVGKACQEATSAGYEVMAEPGRCLVSDAGGVVTSVSGTNIRDGQRWAYIDDGIYGCYSIKLYEQHSFEFYRVGPICNKSTNRDPPINGTWVVAGPTCDSLDVVAKNVTLPLDLSSGDLLYSPNLGAYTVATASAFNGFAPPCCYIGHATFRDGKIDVSIRSNAPVGAPLATEAKHCPENK